MNDRDILILIYLAILFISAWLSGFFMGKAIYKKRKKDGKFNY